MVFIWDGPAVSWSVQMTLRQRIVQLPFLGGRPREQLLFQGRRQAGKFPAAAAWLFSAQLLEGHGLVLLRCRLLGPCFSRRWSSCCRCSLPRSATALECTTGAIFVASVRGGGSRGNIITSRVLCRGWFPILRCQESVHLWMQASHAFCLSPSSRARVASCRIT